MKEERRNEPKIRFPEFTGDWEQRKLGDLVSLRGRIGFRGYKQTDLVEPGSGAITFSPADIDGEGHVSLINNKYLSWEKYEESPEIKVQSGDILFTKTASIGKIGYVKELKEKATINPQFALLTPVEEADGYFIFNSVRIDEFMKKVRDITGGSSVPTMSQEKLKELTIMIPSLAEQVRIGEFLTKLDDTITLHQRKLDGIKEYKKGMLQKMFPKKGETVPEVRFPGFTGDWEQRKWIDTVDISTEMVNPASGEYDDMPHIAPGNIESFTGRVLNNVKLVKEENLISGKFRFRPGDVVYGKINPQLGKYFYASVDGLTSADAYVFNGKNGTNQKFLFSLLQTEDFFKYSVSVSKRSGMPKINRDELNAYNYLAPSEEEQDRIGNFILDIDNLITLHQRELDKWKDLKKGLLQQMFV